MVVRKQVRAPFYEIVVPTDCSSGSTRALEFALALAGHGCKVTAVHAVDPLQYRFGPRQSSKIRKQQVWDLAQESVYRWLRESKLSGCDTIVVEGEAAPAITAFVAAKGADLIVLATSTRGPRRSTAARLGRRRSVSNGKLSGFCAWSESRCS
jgi:nucleotide-binding universal stress UspA family protein